MPAHNPLWRFQMQYLLMLYSEEASWNKLTKAEQEQGVAAYRAYTEALTKAGVLKGSNRLQPSSAATTVRIANGKPQVLDGPYVESKEQIGGYYLILVRFQVETNYPRPSGNAADSFGVRS